MRKKENAKNEKGFVLIAGYLILPLLVLLVTVMVRYALADIVASQRSQTLTQALYLAEAGVDESLVQLRKSYAWNGGTFQTTGGDFSIAVDKLGVTRRRVTAQGIPGAFNGNLTHSVEIIIDKNIPAHFYDNAIWVAKALRLESKVYLINGNIRYGTNDIMVGPGTINGTLTYDPSVNPLPKLNFQQLYDIASAQNNVYDATRLKGGPSVLPKSFWYQPPTDPSDPTTGIPNVNYVTTDLILNGNIGTIGGFFVVVGNVLNNPNAALNATTITGYGKVDGAVYSTGTFAVSAPNPPDKTKTLSVMGGVWAHSKVSVGKGYTNITYSSDYMKAIQALGINPGVTVISWQDLGNQDGS